MDEIGIKLRTMEGGEAKGHAPIKLLHTVMNERT